MILLNHIELKIKRFPNKEAIIDKNDISSLLLPLDYGVNKLVLKYESDLDLMALLLIKRSLWTSCDLHIHYMPYSRMDRTSDDYFFTLKPIADFINWLNFERVWVYEPHSDVTPALLNKSLVVSLMPILLRRAGFNKTKDFVLFPDANAHKKYSSLINAPNYIVGLKERDFKTGKIVDYRILGEVNSESKIFIVDDLCSKGGTFILAAQKLKDNGAKEINLVVPHSEETIFKGRIFNTDLIQHVFTTNTTPKIPEIDILDRLHIFDVDDVVNNAY